MLFPMYTVAAAALLEMVEVKPHEATSHIVGVCIFALRSSRSSPCRYLRDTE